MKSIKFLMTIMLVAMCVSFVSCGDKDQPVDNELEARGVIGEWSYHKKGSGTESRYIFRADGTSLHTLYSGGVPGPRKDYTYTYDKSTSTGKLTSVNDSYTRMFKYEAGAINLYNENGEIIETYSWYAPLPKYKDLLGEWSTKLDDSRERIITFKSDGTLDDGGYKGKGGEENVLGPTYKYSFDEITSSGQIIRIDDNRVVVTFKYIDQRIYVYEGEELVEIYTRRVL